MSMTTNSADAGSGAADTAAAARKAMIDSQLRTSGVNELWVLSAMASIPRERFVPGPVRDAAYIDRAIALGEGRFLAAPLVHARMLAEAAPTRGDKVLLVGDSAGYLAALVTPLVGSLDAVSPADAGKKRRKGPYTLLLVDGAAEELPAPLLAQLGEDGRIVTGLVQRGVTRLAIGRKVAGEVALMPLAEIGIPVLPELAAPQRWSF